MTTPQPTPSTQVVAPRTESHTPRFEGAANPQIITWLIHRHSFATQVIFAMTCLTCGDSAANDESLEVAQEWAMGHTGKTGHRGFASDIRCFWETVRISEEDGKPDGATS